MSYYNLVLILIHFINYSTQSESSPRFSVSSCVPKVLFTECEATAKQPMILYNTLRYQIDMRVQKGCKGSDISSVWSLWNIDKGEFVEFPPRHNKASVMIMKNQLELGNYILTAHITERPSFQFETTVNAECYIKMTTDCPVPVIRGGALRTAPVREMLRITAYSIKCMLEVSYIWKCKSANPFSACENLHEQTGEIVYLPIQGRIGDTINVTLNATAPLGKNRHFQQIIVISKKDTPQVDIICLKNCITTGGIYSNPIVPIYLTANCTSKCHLAKRYQWNIEAQTPTINTAEEIMANGTYGVYSKDLIIKANWLSYEEVYAIYLEAHDDKKVIAKTKLFIKMSKNVAGKSTCTSRHNNKIGINRLYFIKCDIPKLFRPVVYKLHQMYQERGTNYTSSYGLANNYLPRFNVRLAAQGNKELQGLRFIVLDDTMVVTNMTFYVKVPRPFGNITDDEIIAKIKNVYLGHLGTIPIKRMLDLGMVEEACQIISILLIESNKVYEGDPNIRRIIKESHNDIIDDLLEFDKIVGDYEFILAVIPHFAPENPKGILHSKFRSRLCKMVATHVGGYIHTEEYPLGHQGFLGEWTIPVQKCASVYLDDNYEKYTSFNISLPAPIPEHITLVEDYPNYGDIIDDTTVEDFREIISNAISTINLVNEAYSQTLTIGEPRVYLNFTANTTIDVVYAEKKDKLKYDDGKVRVVLPNSLDLAADDYVRVVYTTIPSNAFFWDKRTGNTSDTVLNVNIYDPKHRGGQSYRKRMNLYFKLSKKQTITIFDGEFNVSLKSTAWTDKYVQENRIMFRIEVSQLDNLMTFISDIRPVKSLKMAITKYRKPRKENYTIEIFNDEPYFLAFNKTTSDTFYYVSLLPSEAELNKFANQKRSINKPDYEIKFNGDYTASLNTLEEEKLKITFRYAFTAMSCREWVGALGADDNCDLGMGGDVTTMHCACRNVSSIVGDMKNVQFIPERILEVKYALSVTINSMIPTVTIIIIGVYCLLICLVYYRRKPINLYFLADNLEDDRYAYIVRVNTGACAHASTTSNVTIKLNGKKANSKPHVLNYPDPYLKVLQDGGEDYFVLTTSTHLGTIREIELWFDGVGRRFTWYCDYVKVRDLQLTHNIWFFRVCHRFSVMSENKHHFKCKSTPEEGWNAKRRVHHYFHFYWSADHLWNIFHRKDDPVLTFMERINILLCQILTTCALTLAVIGRPTFRLKDGLNENKFDSCIYILSILMGIAVVVICLFTPLSIILRYTPKKDLFFKHREPLLSDRFNTLCRVIIAIDVSFCIAYLFYFGFWVPRITSLMWLTISPLSLMVNAILLENLKLSIYKWIIGWKTHKKQRNYTLNYYKIIDEVERQRKFIYKRLGRYGLRPYLAHLYKPLSQKKYMEINKRKTMEFKIRKSATDMAFFYSYASLLFLLLLLKLNMMTFVSSKHMIDIVFRDGMRTKPSAMKVRTFEDFYEYLNNTLASVLHPMAWYGRWKVSEPGLLADYNTKIIGVARIRQKRVRESYCPIPYVADMLNITYCYRESLQGFSDRSDAGLSKSMWSFQITEHGNWHSGEMDLYSGRGFIMKLGRNLNNTYYVIQLMRNANWLGRETRVVFVEIWTYNANQNLFNAITVIFERSATKLMVVSNYIITLELMHTTKTDEVLTIVIFILFCVFICRLILKYIRQTVKTRLINFLSLTNLWEMFIIVTNITIIVLYLRQFDQHIAVFFQMADSKYNEFISYYKIMNNYQAIRNVTAILFAVAIARGITFMKFVSIFRIFEKVLKLSFMSFFAATVFSTIILAVFTMSGRLLFGPSAHSFRNLRQSAYTLGMKALGIKSDFSQNIIENYNALSGYAFFTVYAIIVIYMRTIYVVTTIVFYEKSKLEMSQAQNPYTFAHFARDTWKHYAEIWKRRFIRLKAGKDNVQVRQMATPKEDQYRYKNCVFISDDRLHSMNLIATAFVRKVCTRCDKKLPPNDKDFDLMRNITVMLLTTSDENLSSNTMFFRDKDTYGRVKVVSNNNLKKMEFLVNQMLKPSEQIEIQSNLEDTDSLRKMDEIENILTTIDTLVGNISIKTKRRRKV